MRKNGMVGIMITAALVLGLLAGCGQKEAAGSAAKATDAGSVAKAETGEAQGKNLRIGVCLFTKNDEWLAEISDQFESQGTKKGYEISVQDGNQENEKQMQQIENFIAKQYDAIVVSAADVEGILPAIDKCQEAGIPVIAIDTPIEHEWVSTCISWDNYATGKALGEYAVSYIQEHLKEKDEVHVVLINAPAYPHLAARDEGFREALKAEPKAKIIVEQESPGSREIAANIINNNIAKGIDMVYGVVDNHAWGAVTALEEAQAEACCVLSCGGYGEEPFTALEQDHPYYKALIVVPPQNVVTDSLDAVEKILNGETVDKITNIEFGLASHETVENYK